MEEASGRKTSNLDLSYSAHVPDSQENLNVGIKTESLSDSVSPEFTLLFDSCHKQKGDFSH